MSDNLSYFGNARVAAPDGPVKDFGSLQGGAGNPPRVCAETEPGGRDLKLSAEHHGYSGHY